MVLWNSYVFRSYKVAKVGIAINIVVAGKSSGTLLSCFVSEQALPFKKSILNKMGSKKCFHIYLDYEPQDNFLRYILWGSPRSRWHIFEVVVDGQPERDSSSSHPRAILTTYF